MTKLIGKSKLVLVVLGDTSIKLLQFIINKKVLIFTIRKRKKKVPIVHCSALCFRTVICSVS